MEKQKVFGTYKASPSNHVCIHCGACIASCEEGALTLKYHWQDVLDAIDSEKPHHNARFFGKKLFCYKDGIRSF